MIGGHALNWLEGRLQSLTKRRGKRNGLSLEFLLALSLLGLAHSCWLRGDPYDPQKRPSVPMCAGWNGTIVLHCFSLGLFAATQLNFRSSTATFASTTNLQSFPLNGGGTVSKAPVIDMEARLDDIQRDLDKRG